MKFYLLFCILISNICYGQQWQAEIMGGVAGYNGDLTEKRININELRPAGTLNIKYNSGDFVNFRIGVSYASVGADDKNNPNQAYKNRNLNFKTNIVEINAAAEIVLLDPEVYTAYHFVFGGIGIFHFNPYTSRLIFVVAVKPALVPPHGSFTEPPYTTANFTFFVTSRIVRLPSSE